MISPAILACAPSGGGGVYTAPLDIVPGAIVAYSQRAMAAAQRGSALFTLREASGNTTQSFLSDATTGLPNVAAITAFLNGAAGFYTKWNGQSGAGTDVQQADAALQPGLVVAGPGSLPMVNPPAATGTKGILITAGDVTTPAAGVSFYVVVKGAADPATGVPFAQAGPSFNPDNYALLGAGSNNFANITNTCAITTGAPSVNVFDGVAHIVYGSIDGSSSYLSIDGAAQDTSTSILGILDLTVAPFIVGDDTTDGSDVPWPIGISEIVQWSGVIGTTDRTAIIANVAAAYGITLS